MTRNYRGPRRTAGRPGFTVVELVTVAGVIGLLLALLIPAVMASRRAARKAHCQNNLRQVGIALHLFEERTGTFPPAWYDPLPGLASQFSPHVNLLPGLDEGPLFASLNVATALPMAPGATDAVVAAWQCPEDPVRGGTSYRACTGAAARIFHPTRDPGGAATAGTFQLLLGVPAAAIRDGLTQTAAFSEKRKGRAGDGWDPAVGGWYTALAAGRDVMPGDAALLKLCDGYLGAPATYSADSGDRWHQAGYRWTLYNHLAPPNAPFPDCSAASRPTDGLQSGAYAANSDHRGGVNLLLTDGSVRFTADAVEPMLWRAAATRDGREVDGF